MTRSVFVTIWLSGWLCCCAAYIVSAINKAKIYATKWNDNIYWPIIIFFTVFWPIVIIVNLWLILRVLFGHPMHNDVSSGLRSTKKRNSNNLKDYPVFMSKKIKPEDDSFAVFYTDHDVKCRACNRDIEKHSLIFIEPVKGKICLSCAGLNELVILPSGNTALTVRSRKYSRISAVILRYNKSRKRFERQGVLVEEKALEQAKRDCEADAGKREIKRGKSAVRREKFDQEYKERFAARLRELFPYCPVQVEFEIAKHACEKYSGRVGRSAEAKTLNDQYIRLAVIAHIRHTETDYDDLLSSMYKKREARKLIRDKVEEILSLWEQGKSDSNLN